MILFHQLNAALLSYLEKNKVENTETFRKGRQQKEQTAKGLTTKLSIVHCFFNCKNDRNSLECLT